jgi:hypothetical protein
VAEEISKYMLDLVGVQFNIKNWGVNLLSVNMVVG